jgi:hypothetical protein
MNHLVAYIERDDLREAIEESTFYERLTYLFTGKLEAKKAKFRKLAARHKLQEYDDKLWKKLNDNNT